MLAVVGGYLCFWIPEALDDDSFKVRTKETEVEREVERARVRVRVCL